MFSALELVQEMTKEVVKERKKERRRRRKKKEKKKEKKFGMLEIPDRSELASELALRDRRFGMRALNLRSHTKEMSHPGGDERGGHLSRLIIISRFLQAVQWYCGPEVSSCCFCHGARR